MDRQRRSQFSGYHRGLTVLLGGKPEPGPEPSEEDQQVARRLVRCVTELVNRPDCHSGFGGFDSHTHRQQCSCSSAEECLASNQGVGSSNLSRSSNERSMMRDSSVVERLAHNQDVASSILAPATNRERAMCLSVHRSGYIRPGRARMAEHSTDNRAAAGSNPAPWTMREVGGEVVESSGPPTSPPEGQIMYADSSAGRAPGLHPGGRGFDALSAYQSAGGLVAGRLPSKQINGSSNLPRRSNREGSGSSMVEHSPYKRAVGEFESPLDYQSLISPARAGGSTVEQGVLNPKVAGSTPVRPTSRTVKPALVAQLVEHPAFNRGVQGSIPCGRTNRGSVAQRTEHRASTPSVEGLNPSGPSKARRLRRKDGSVAQVGRAPVSKTGGCGFEARPACHLRRWQRTHLAPVAQLVEHPPCKRTVVGSNPGQGLQSPLTTTKERSGEMWTATFNGEFQKNFPSRPSAWDWILEKNGMALFDDRPGMDPGARSRHNKLAELRRAGWVVTLCGGVAQPGRAPALQAG